MSFEATAGTTEDALETNSFDEEVTPGAFDNVPFYVIVAFVDTLSFKSEIGL